MTNEEKHLLLIDLCARLPYGVIVDNPDPAGGAWDAVINIDTSAETVTVLYNGYTFSVDDVMPYLRSMSSMTEKEKAEYYETHEIVLGVHMIKTLRSYDWLNKHHFDYRGLIPMGLALEAPEGMYKTEKI